MFSTADIPVEIRKLRIRIFLPFRDLRLCRIGDITQKYPAVLPDGFKIGDDHSDPAFAGLCRSSLISLISFRSWQ